MSVKATNKKSKIELLAPAGGKEAMVAAVSAGADAVYFGGKAYSARMSAHNFDDSEILHAIDYCKKRGVKAFIAANTLITDRETENYARYIEKVYHSGADAVIVQDIGMAKIILDELPRFPVHASTQMTVNTLESAQAVAQIGCKRVVLARELSKDQIENITRNIDIETEVFVHGALCASISGQCLMSSMIGGRSANRGRCAQPCRLRYRDDKENGTLLSLKDIAYLSHLDELIACGVASLKIEGRMKGADYVGTVVDVYRRALDGLGEARDKDRLRDVFYRGEFTDKYFTGQKNREMYEIDKPENPYRNRVEIRKFVQKEETFLNLTREPIAINVDKSRGKNSVKRLELTACVSNKEQLGPLRKAGIRVVENPAKTLGELKSGAWGEYTLNVFNSLALKQVADMGAEVVCLSPELMLAQIRDIRKCVPVEVIAYGRIPLMNIENPPKGMLVDRTGAKFPIIGTQILNSTPIYMADKLKEIKDAGVSYARMYFTTETPKQVEEIIESYKTGAPPPKNFTRGGFYKGV